MPTYIGSPPSELVIPVTLGCDARFTIDRVDADNVPVDFGGDVYLQVDIDKTNPTQVDAVVSGNLAVVNIDNSVCDLVKNTTRWRAILATTDTDDPDELFETPLAVGTFERHDG